MARSERLATWNPAILSRRNCYRLVAQSLLATGFTRSLGTTRDHGLAKAGAPNAPEVEVFGLASPRPPNKSLRGLLDRFIRFRIVASIEAGINAMVVDFVWGYSLDEYPSLSIGLTCFGKVHRSTNIAGTANRVLGNNVYDRYDD